MSDQTSDDHLEFAAEETRQGFGSSDVVAVLAVSSFLGAIRLVTFFVTTALG